MASRIPAGARVRPSRFTGNEAGSVAIIFALTLPVVLGVTALVAEYGQGLIDQTENQRVADLAAYAGALAYGANSDEAAMEAAARAVVVLNGKNGETATVELVDSPRSADADAVRVVVRSENTLVLATILPGIDSLLPINAQAFAELGTAAREMVGCILALSGLQSGVTLSGGTSIIASDCAVSSNSSVTVPCGTQIAAAVVNYNSGVPPSVGCNGITGDIIKTESVDPLANAPGVLGATARIATVRALTGPATPAAPAAPTVPNGTNLTLNWNSSSGVPAGCSAVWVSSPAKWTVTCAAGATYNIGSLSVGGGINLEFRTSGTAATTYNFSGNLVTQATMQFGAGNYNIRGNLQTAGTTTFGNGNFHIGGNMQLTGANSFGAGNRTVVGNFSTSGGSPQTFGAGNWHVGGNFTLSSSGGQTFGPGNFTLVRGLRSTGGGSGSTFGAGIFHLGRETSDCQGGGIVSLCNTTTLTIAGPSTFNFHSGFYTTGGSRLNLGVGTSSGFWFGPSSGGRAIYQGGGAITVMGDQVEVAPRFDMVGHVDVSSGGGSCLTIPAAAHHDIKGNFTSAGGTIMGAGAYTIDGHFSLGATGGGAVNCNGTMVGLHGTDVTITVSGLTTSTGWQCQGQVFCVTAGYTNVRLTAPRSGDLAGLVVVGPTDPTITAGATFSGGADAQLSGAFYMPYGPISLSGGAGIGGTGGAEGCLQLTGSRVTLTGGTTAVSECVIGDGAEAGAVARVRLVQ